MRADSSVNIIEGFLDRKRRGVEYFDPMYVVKIMMREDGGVSAILSLDGEVVASGDSISINGALSALANKIEGLPK